MKIVKTNSRYRLHKMGFPIALKFNSHGAHNVYAVMVWLSERYGPEPWAQGEKRHHSWCSIMGKWSRKKGQDTFIGIKDESVITALVLALGLEVVK